MTYEFHVEPAGDGYRDLLAGLAAIATRSYLIVRHSIPPCVAIAEVLSTLSPHLIRSEIVGSWPGTQLLGPKATMHTYRVGPAYTSALLSVSDRLYAWQQPALPEDLGFLRDDGTWILSTIAHESDGRLEVSESEWRRLVSLVPGIESAVRLVGEG